MLATCPCARPRCSHSLASCFSSKELNGSQLHYIVSMLKTNPAWIRSQGDSLALEVARRRPETNPFIASARFAVDITAGVGWVRRRRRSGHSTGSEKVGPSGEWIPRFFLSVGGFFKFRSWVPGPLEFGGRYRCSVTKRCDHSRVEFWGRGSDCWGPEGRNSQRRARSGGVVRVGTRRRGACSNDVGRPPPPGGTNQRHLNALTTLALLRKTSKGAWPFLGVPNQQHQANIPDLRCT